MNKTYFLPIKSVNLPHYFQKGCICSSKYIDGRNLDIQDSYNDFLVFSNIPYTSETDCALEIVLNAEEEEVIHITNNFFLFNKPLPISRVKKVIFKTLEQLTSSQFNIEIGAAFLPKELLVINTSTEEANTSQIRTKIVFEKQKKDWTKELEVFDRLMGGLALMKIAKEKDQNYPQNYFKVVSCLNSLIASELVSQSVPVSKDYSWAIFKNKKNRVLELLYKSIHSTNVSDALNYFASQDKVNLDDAKSNGKYRLDLIKQNTNTYLIAILASYGEGTRMKLDTFISDFIQGKFTERKEGIALAFGLNKGYKAFRNKYKTQNFQIEIKFKLSSQVEYYIIESVYQYAINNQIDNNAFPYLDAWCPKNNGQGDLSLYQTYDVLDEKIIIQKKDLKKDLFQDLFQRLSRSSIYRKIAIEVNKLLPSYISNNYSKQAENHFSSLLEDDLKEYTYTVFNKIYTEVELCQAKINELIINDKKQKEIIRNQEQKISELLLSKQQYLKSKSENLTKTSNTQNEKMQMKLHLDKSPINRPEKLINNTNYEDFIVKMKSWTLAKVKEEAKKRGIPRYTTYNKTNKDTLINEIIKKLKAQ